MLGKLIGAALGSLINLPFGTLFGLWLGHRIDRTLSQITAPFRNAMHGAGLGAKERTQAQKIFFNATFSIMGHIAKADGHVSQSEIEQAKSVMVRLQLSEELKQKAITEFNRGKSADFNLDSELNQLIQYCQQQPALLQIFLDIQQSAATVDGAHPKRQKILNTISTRLGHQTFDFFQFFQDAQFQYHQQHHRQYAHNAPPPEQGPNPYTVLGLKSSATNAEIKKAYRRLISQNHPDKLVSQGLPEEMIKVATAKTQTIQKAYDELRKERGIR